MRWLSFLVLALLAGAAAAVEIRGVQARVAGADTSLLFDLSESTAYTVSTLARPERLVIEFKHATARRLLTLAPMPKSITHVRQFLRVDQGLTVVVELREANTVAARLLKPGAGAGHRLELQLTPRAARQALAARAAAPAPAPVKVTAPTPIADPVAPAGPKPATPAAVAIASEPAPARPAAATRGRELVIAIDAGHGGQDVGAIGPSGVYEKDVVLGVSRELAQLIAAEPGMRAVLTRDGDYFLPLRTRMDRARARRADLFISIHADAVRDRRARGASVYTLSRRGATSEAARWLAASENAADLVGGASLDDKDRMLKSVLLDLSQAASMDASMDLASAVLRSLGGIGAVHNRRVQQAGFMVLKSPDVPSILVETAYISNPTEEKRLRSTLYQKRLARAIFNGILSYSRAQRAAPAPAPAQATRSAARQREADARRHRVSRGETLSGIAQRYDVDIASLKVANNMDSEMVRAGALLRIP
ncbi:MAG: N-acetylmuramoyl-L-alanine amidase [Gammaproteobacteria bacterium]